MSFFGARKSQHIDLLLLPNELQAAVIYGVFFRRKMRRATEAEKGNTKHQKQKCDYHCEYSFFCGERSMMLHVVVTRHRESNERQRNCRDKFMNIHNFD